MRWKMENANKVKNIVDGSYEGLVDLYSPLILEMEQDGILYTIKDGLGKISAIKFRHKRDN